MKELSEEEVMENDLDPLEAIRAIRREEGVAEDDLPGRDEELAVSDTDILREKEEEEDGEAQGALSDAEQSEELEETPEGRPVDDSGEENTSQDTKDADADPDSQDASAEQDNQEEKADSKESKGPKGLTFKANGQDFNFTQEEIMEQFETVFGKAMNYTQKMQAIAPYRKMISALEQEGITHEKLNIAIDALKGDKGALKKLMEDNSIDAYDLTNDEEGASPYQPNQYGKNDTQLDIEEITSRIQGDQEFRITTNVIDEQWDGRSRQMILENPNMILGLHEDIKTGIYDKVAPVAMKMKVLDGNSKSDIEYYMLAGQQVAVATQAEMQKQDGQKEVDRRNAETQAAESKFDEASSQADRKRAASSTGARADRKGVIDYLDDDDEAFDEWYKNLTSNI